ncbi:hypothetical protein [Sphingomonas elodea]|uniref:hypothetical protein n=1 Tax=Sphingomonas elodea TaxID=179878 RepID=UPI00026303B5|nr:hypothetical protein [Sphingomonas elodea]
MTELDRALSELAFIQDRFAASTRFRGLTPQAVAMTGLLALTLAAAQTVAPSRFGGAGVPYVVAWVAAAGIATGLIAVDALERARRMHGGLADLLIASTLRLLLPFGAAGAMITFVIARSTPEAIWILPGLWQLLIALIGFSAVSTLPPAIVWPAGWYFACGSVTLVLAGQSGVPTPWMMGVPFGVGQLLVAVTLRQARRYGG